MQPRHHRVRRTRRRPHHKLTLRHRAPLRTIPHPSPHHHRPSQHHRPAIQHPTRIPSHRLPRITPIQCVVNAPRPTHRQPITTRHHPAILPELRRSRHRPQPHRTQLAEHRLAVRHIEFRRQIRILHRRHRRQPVTLPRVHRLQWHARPTLRIPIRRRIRRISPTRTLRHYPAVQLVRRTLPPPLTPLQRQRPAIEQMLPNTIRKQQPPLRILP